MPATTEAVIMNHQFDRLGIKQRKLVEKKPICDECALINNRNLGIFKTKRKCALCHRKSFCSLTTEKLQTSVLTRPDRDSDGDPIFHCPDCGNNISHLNYSEPCYAYGTYSLSTERGDGDYNEDEHDTTGGDMNYTCPDCGADVDREDIENDYTTNSNDEDEESEEGGGGK